MKVLLVPALILLLALSATAGGNIGAPPFPFLTYPEARSIRPACGGTAVAAVINDEWQALSSETRDVWAHQTQGEIDYIYLTVGGAGSGPTVTQVLTIAEASRLYPDPCTYLAEISA